MSAQPHLTVAYMTNRREPMFRWFCDSFHRECGGDYTGVKLVMVDFYADYPGRRAEVAKVIRAPLTHLPPKPTVWQGESRLTTQDYFAAANARNTALCVAPDGYVVYVDDISVLLPGWLAEVRRMVALHAVACGTYEKVLGLEVGADGNVGGYRAYGPGMDSRRKLVLTDDPVPCTGSWMYGASVAIPVEGLLAINGWDEDADSMSGEDYLCGIMLERAGYVLRFCGRMKTLESEERHHLEVPFKRIIKPGRPDASHRLLNMVVGGGRKRAPNYADLTAVRDAVLYHNQPFPPCGTPEHDWRDGQPLREM